MNLLQDLPREAPLFVTLNPVREPDPARTLRTETYSHPLFDAAALRAEQAALVGAGRGRRLRAGAHRGAGFHEEWMRAGVAVA